MLGCDPIEKEIWRSWVKTLDKRKIHFHMTQRYLFIKLVRAICLLKALKYQREWDKWNEKEHLNSPHTRIRHSIVSRFFLLFFLFFEIGIYGYRNLPARKHHHHHPTHITIWYWLTRNCGKRRESLPPPLPPTLLLGLLLLVLSAFGCSWFGLTECSLLLLFITVGFIVNLLFCSSMPAKWDILSFLFFSFFLASFDVMHFSNDLVKFTCLVKINEFRDRFKSCSIYQSMYTIFVFHNRSVFLLSLFSFAQSQICIIDVYVYGTWTEFIAIWRTLNFPAKKRKTKSLEIRWLWAIKNSKFMQKLKKKMYRFHQATTQFTLLFIFMRMMREQ